MKTYKIEFLDSNDNDHFTIIKQFNNKKQAAEYAKLILANLCDNEIIKFKVL